mgnify:CR=1 FL=1
MHVLPFAPLYRNKFKQYSNNADIDALRKLKIENTYSTLTNLTDQFYEGVKETLLVISSKITNESLLNEVLKYAKDIVYFVKMKININVPNRNNNKKAIENVIANVTDILSIVGQIVLGIRYKNQEEYKKLVIVLDNLIRLSSEVYRYCMTLAVEEGICISVGLLSIC